ncbi:MAG: hypothetical protein KAF91_03155 [Nostoc sp. TH1S01]|nr:hypothetical protein [Nostoc sp. TH1S01]
MKQGVGSREWGVDLLALLITGMIFSHAEAQRARVLNVEFYDFIPHLELIRKENLKETQLITMSKFQRISAVLTQIPETLTR